MTDDERRPRGLILPVFSDQPYLAEEGTEPAFVLNQAIQGRTRQCRHLHDALERQVNPP